MFGTSLVLIIKQFNFRVSLLFMCTTRIQIYYNKTILVFQYYSCVLHGYLYFLFIYMTANSTQFSYKSCYSHYTLQFKVLDFKILLIMRYINLVTPSYFFCHKYNIPATRFNISLIIILFYTTFKVLPDRGNRLSRLQCHI